MTLVAQASLVRFKRPLQYRNTLTPTRNSFQIQSRQILSTHIFLSRKVLLKLHIYTVHGSTANIVVFCAIFHNDLTINSLSRVTYICVNNITIISSDDRRQAFISTNAWILLIGPLRINFNEILIEIRTFSFKKIHLTLPSGKWRPSCLCLSVLKWM